MVQSENRANSAAVWANMTTNLIDALEEVKACPFGCSGVQHPDFLAKDPLDTNERGRGDARPWASSARAPRTGDEGGSAHTGAEYLHLGNFEQPQKAVFLSFPLRLKTGLPHSGHGSLRGLEGANEDFHSQLEQT